MGILLIGLVAIFGLAAESRTVWDGVFTNTQADRGKSQYQIFCSSCHGTALQGGLDGVEQAPRLRRDDFMRNRGDLGNAFAFIKEWMPRDAPGTLRDADYADILAYLLKENGFPAGAEPLVGDQATLAIIRIVPRQ